MNTFFEDLKPSPEEAAAMADGAPIGRYHHFPEPQDVRKRAKLTQARMAAVMGISLSGYQKWEQNVRSPSGPALTLLRVMDKNPEVVIEALS